MAWNRKPLSTTAVVIHKVRLKGNSGRVSTPRVGMQVSGQRSKNNNLLLHEMQAPNVALSYLLLLQTLQLLEMVMWKD